MTTTAAVLRGRPAWTIAFAGGLVGAALGITMGSVITITFLVPAVGQPTPVAVEAMPAARHDLQHQHVLREYPLAAPAIERAALDTHELLRQHVLREYPVAPSAMERGALDTHELLRQHLLREYGP